MAALHLLMLILLTKQHSPRPTIPLVGGIPRGYADTSKERVPVQTGLSFKEMGCVKGTRKKEGK